MSNKSTTIPSLFDSIYNNCNGNISAENMSANYDKIMAEQMGVTISDMSFDVTTDKIMVSIDVYDKFDNEETEFIDIPLDDFRAYVEEKDLLSDYNTGGHSCDGGTYEDSTRTITIGFTEFLQDCLTAQHIKSYLIEKKLVTYAWDENAI